jgi:capsular exopolysaccharide synthesis family protein
MLGLAAASLSVSMSDPLFTARAQLLIDPKIPQSVRAHTGEVPVSLDASQVETEMTILRSEKIAARVVEDLKLDRDAEFGAPPAAKVSGLLRWALDEFGLKNGGALLSPVQSPAEEEKAERALASVLTRLEVRRVGLSHTVEIAFSSNRPSMAAMVANAITDAYVREQVGARAQAARQGSAWLEEGIDKLRAKMNAAERQAQELRSKHDYRLARPIEGLEQLRSDRARSSAAPATLEELDAVAASYRTLYESSLQALASSLQRESFPVSDARVITAAKPPTAKSHPRTSLILALGAFSGALAGFGLAFTRHSLDQTVRTSRQLEEMSFCCLGHIPRVDATWKSTSSRIREYVTGNRGAECGAGVRAPLSPFVESLKSLKLCITANQGSSGLKTLGVTSSLPGEGKSTVSSNLAALFAESGYRTLLVDADIRRASLTSDLTPRCRGGLVEVLLNKLEVEQSVVPSAQVNLAFLPAKSLASNGSENNSLPRVVIPHSYDLLGSGRMTQLLEGLAEAFDIILFDLPPLALTADAFAISPLLDGVIVLAEWGVTPTDVLTEMSRSLNASPAKVLGTVLTKVDLRFSNAY